MAKIQLSSPTNITSGVPVFPFGAIAITPSDADTFSEPVSVYVGVAGNVAVIPGNGVGGSVTFVGVPAGSVLPCQVRTVLATGTTASSLVAIY